MGMQLPEWVRTMFLVTTGDGWPEADENGLRTLAREWSSVAEAITMLEHRLGEPVLVGRRGGWGGPAADSFAAAGDMLAAHGNQQLTALVQGSRKLSTFVDDTGANVEYVKLIVLGQLVILAGQITYLASMAGLTFGASTAGMPALQAAGRAFAVTAVRQLLLSIGVAEVLQVGLDVTIQALQTFVLHTRREWDDQLTSTAAITGAVGAVLGPVMGAVGGVVCRAASQAVGKTAAEAVERVGVGAVHEYGTAAGTGLVTGQGGAGTLWDLTAGATDNATDAAGQLLRRRRGGPVVTMVSAADGRGDTAGSSGAPARSHTGTAAAPPAPSTLVDTVGLAPRSTMTSVVAGDRTIAASAGRGLVDMMRVEPEPAVTVTVRVPEAVTGYATMVETCAPDGGHRGVGELSETASSAPVVVAGWGVASGVGVVAGTGRGGAARPGDGPNRPAVPQHEPGPETSSYRHRPVAGEEQVGADTVSETGPGAEVLPPGRQPGRDQDPPTPVWTLEAVDAFLWSAAGETGAGDGVGEVADGMTVTEWLARGPTSPSEAWRVGDVAADGSLGRVGSPMWADGADVAPSDGGWQSSVTVAPVRGEQQPSTDDDGGFWAFLEQPFDDEQRDLSAAFIDATPPTIDQVLRGADPFPDVLAGTVGQPSSGSVAGRQPIGPVDPTMPMVVTRTADRDGRIYLGMVKEDATGKSHLRQLYLGGGLHDQQVDVRFDDTGMFVIAKDLDGRDIVVPSDNRMGWTLTGEEFSQFSEVRNTTAPPPPPTVDPTRPMVITRRVNRRGRVNLGKVEEGVAGKSRWRRLCVGGSLFDQWVDVHFGDAGLSVIAKDGNGRDTVVPIGDRRKWTLTGEEFSRLPDVRNITAAEAVSPAVTGAADRHTVADVGSGPSGDVVTVIADQRQATTPPPAPLWPAEEVDAFLASAEGETEAAAGTGDDAGFLALLEQPFDELRDLDLFAAFIDATPPTIDQVLRGADPFPDVLAGTVGQPSSGSVAGRHPVGQVDALTGGPDDRSLRQHRRSGEAPTKRSAGQAGLDSAIASSSQDGQPRGKRRAARSGSSAPAGAHHVSDHEQSSRLPDPCTTSTAGPLPPPTVGPVDPTMPMVVTRPVDKRGRVYLGREKGGGAGKSRLLHVGPGLRGKQVDVRFDDTGLSVIAKDGNGRDAVVPISDRREWTLTGEEFSRFLHVRNTTAPLPSPTVDPVDPNRPMVVTRKVGMHGCVSLGSTEGDDAGKRHPRLLYIRGGLYGQSVDVRFGDTELSVIAKNHDGPDIVITLSNRTEWALTNEEFSRLPDARNITVPEAVSPAVTGAAEKHTVADVGSGPSGDVVTVIADQRQTTASPPTPVAGVLRPQSVLGSRRAGLR